MKEHDTDDTTRAISYTARLIAHYRAMESKRQDPLIIDPFAEKLAGDMDSYFKEHRRTHGTGDYPVVRTHFIDNHILAPWCNAHEKSQIVLLGAGLDTRAYRFDPLGENEHTVFEVDFDIVNNYKTGILRDDRPLCGLVRVSADLSQPGWVSRLQKAGFLHDIPTLWILEGFVYYIEQDTVASILKTAAKSCAEGSQIFTDICVPGLTLAEYGPFMRYFKWGLNKDDVSPFFAHAGWSVTSVFADDFDHGRDVGQRGLIFVTGARDLSPPGMPMAILDKESEHIPESEIRSFSVEFVRSIIPEIESITSSYKNKPDEGLKVYFEFIERITPKLQQIIRSINNLLSIGHISSRLLRDPTTVTFHSREEEEAHLVGYLKAILLLGYCGAKDIAGEQFSSTNIYSEGMKTTNIGQLLPLAYQIQKEVENL